MGQFCLQTFYDPSMFHFLFYLCIYSIYSMFFQLKLLKVVVTKHNLALFLLPWQFFQKGELNLALVAEQFCKLQTDQFGRAPQREGA